MSDEILLTKVGYDRVVAELENLVTVRRKEVAERIKEAISYGDISENSEYDSAKNEQAELEDRINRLENMLRKAKIINESEISNDRVSVGLKVLVRDETSGEEVEYIIVGSTEADPFEGKISNESSLGAALLGKKKNDQIEIQVPDGMFKYVIVDIYK
ncbi:MAG: transcription elongation factor GreA [Clostridiales bacterium]|nr:transcription elongation factor GreA [Clostridiales bacterium]